MHRHIKTVSTGIDWWLRQELASSRDGRNGYLDDFDTGRRFFFEDADIRTNVDTAKSQAHFKRFSFALQAFEMTEGKDAFITGKVIHHALMFISGGFRTQAMLQSAAANDYQDFRFGKLDTFGGATGIDLAEEVSRNLDKPVLSLPALCVQNENLNQQIHTKHMSIYSWFAEHPLRRHDALTVDDEPVRSALETQRYGLGIAIGHILFAADQLEGDVSKVPFLEPKSISDVSSAPIYPIPA